MTLCFMLAIAAGSFAMALLFMWTLYKAHFGLYAVPLGAVLTLFASFALLWVIAPLHGWIMGAVVLGVFPAIVIGLIRWSDEND